MPWNPANALTDFGSGIRRLLTFEEALQGAINANQDALRTEATPRQVASTPSSVATITATADIALVAGDSLFVQQCGINPLFVRRGTGASSSDFNYVLAGGGANDDGTGGALIIDDFVGTVSFAGTSVRYKAWKR
ncbi:MAG: hypothetical protein Q8M02_14635 [Candidatus Didemnitutus sp.]|nr:hypothetical protein [Candidatus Didemnitutus sp.]